MVAIRLGDIFRGVRLSGAASALRSAIDAPLPPAERARYADSLAEARTQLDDVSWEEAWSGGETMTFEQVVDYALTESSHE